MKNFHLVVIVLVAAMYQVFCAPAYGSASNGDTGETYQGGADSSPDSSDWAGSSSADTDSDTSSELGAQETSDGTGEEDTVPYDPSLVDDEGDTPAFDGEGEVLEGNPAADGAVEAAMKQEVEEQQSSENEADLYKDDEVDEDLAQYMGLEVYKTHACENDQLKLDCPSSDERLHIISAMYGRKTKTICNREPIKTLACSGAKEAKTVMRNICHEKMSCVVEAGNNEFTDPCPGTYKYLQVQYICRPINS